MEDNRLDVHIRVFVKLFGQFHPVAEKLVEEPKLDVALEKQAIKAIGLRGEPETIEKLLDNTHNKIGMTKVLGQTNGQIDESLIEAVRLGDAVVLQELLAAGADPSKWNNACLRWALDEGKTEIAEILKKAIEEGN